MDKLDFGDLTPDKKPEAETTESTEDVVVEELSWDSEPVEVVEAEVVEEIPAELTDDEADTAIMKQGMSLADMRQIGDVAVASNRFPAIFNSEQAIISILAGREIGLGPLKSLQELYVVEGKVAMSAGLIASMVKKSGKYNYTIDSHDNEHCVLTFTENGEEAGVSSFSMEDAQIAGLVRQGSGWTKYPRNMLFARALTNGARWFCADAFTGAVYTPEELQVDVDNPSEDRKLSSTSAPVAGEYKWFTPSGETESGDELCPIHWNHKPTLDDNRGRPVYFFKRGKMRGYAHPVAGEKKWCDFEAVASRYKEQVTNLMDTYGISPSDRRDAGERLMEEVAHLPLGSWRVVDWWELANRLDDEYGGTDAQ